VIVILPFLDGKMPVHQDADNDECAHYFWPHRRLMLGAQLSIQVEPQ
jgi:hypothetical protein